MPIETVTSLRAAPLSGDLTDLVDIYTTADDLPPAGWMVQHALSRPEPGLKTLSRGTRLAKRLCDISLSLAALILLWPLLLAVAVLVKLTSPGPAIFKQVRTGLNLRLSRKDRRTARSGLGLPPPGFEDRRSATEDRRREPSFGKPFVLYKFRTMRVDAEENGACFAVEDDPRVTPVGRLLRRTRLDELPQLWNVLRGEMSLVGPRPERPEFIESLSHEIPGYLHRLRLKPGLTGLAQVINGYDNNIESFRKKVALDLLYLQNCSFWNDLRILVRTIGVVLTGKGAL